VTADNDGWFGRARGAGAVAWQSHRREALSQHGLWEAYKDVPPPRLRDRPVSEYVSGEGGEG